MNSFLSNLTLNHLDLQAELNLQASLVENMMFITIERCDLYSERIIYKLTFSRYIAL